MGISSFTNTVADANTTISTGSFDSALPSFLPNSIKLPEFGTTELKTEEIVFVSPEKVNQTSEKTATDLTKMAGNGTDGRAYSDIRKNWSDQVTQSVDAVATTIDITT